MKYIALLLLIPALAACDILKQIDSPEERYYTLTQSVTTMSTLAKRYVLECNERAETDPCKDVLPKIHKAAVAVDKTMDEADRVFVSKDSDYYDLSLSLVENALSNLKKILTEG